jgi:hypothetical protein
MVPLVPHWGKMPTKLALEIVLYALVITMFTYKFWCEKDCYIEKVLVKYNFMETITIEGFYIPPSESCIHVVKKSNMACISHILNHEDKIEISVLHMSAARHSVLEVNAEVSA